MKTNKTISKQDLFSKIKADYENSAKNDFFHLFDNGWKSTSQKSPMLGMIFCEIEPKDMAWVKFTDKYGNKYQGFLNSIYYEKSTKGLGYSIKTTDMGLSGDYCTNYLVFNPKSFKIISGKLPQISLPKF